jgi:glycosyltransferase involved in cell wall biosynthesis
MNIPSYSVIIETANLSLADLAGLRVTVESLAGQSLPVQGAREVILADSGDVATDVLREVLVPHPWVRPMKLPEGTGYEELKMAGAQASTGDIVVFADGDCLYERGWLEALLAPFSDPGVTIVGGETAIDSAGPYGLGVAMAASFPARASSPAMYESDRYHLNNVAFRRSVLLDVPIPSRQPCYRMSGLHAARLLAGGHRIVRQPAALATHASPNGLSHFIWRFLLMGYDGVVVPRLIAAELPRAERTRVQRKRTFGLIRFWAAQACRKIGAELRRKPSRVLELPLALPIFASAVVLQAAGALAGLVAPRWFIQAVPDDVLRGSTCERAPAAAEGPSRPANAV